MTHSQLLDLLTDLRMVAVKHGVMIHGTGGSPFITEVASEKYIATELVVHPDTTQARIEGSSEVVRVSAPESSPSHPSTAASDVGWLVVLFLVGLAGAGAYFLLNKP